MKRATRSGAHGRPTDTPDVRGPLLALVLAPIQFVLAWAASSSLLAFGALVGFVVATIAVLLWPTLLLVLAFPASFGVMRVGPAAIDMSLADFTAGLAALASLPFVPWRSNVFRRALKVMLLYCAVISVSVVLHPSLTGAVEVGHRFVMVMGAVCIGTAVVNLGKVTAALRALVLFATYFSIVAISDAISSGFDPAYPLKVQKNAAGSLLAVTIIAFVFAHPYLRWPRKVTVPVGLVMLGGLAATQSRGAMFALAAVVGIFIIRTVWGRKNRRLLALVAVLLIPGVAMVGVAAKSLQDNIDSHQGSDEKFGSVGSRRSTFDRTVNDVIKPNVALGAGPKWFTLPDAPAGAPHNIVLGELSDVGIIGTAAFVFLIWTVLRLARMGGPILGEMAFYALLSRFLSTMADIFWVAGPNTLPFLMLGLAIGAAARDRSETTQPYVLSPT